MKKTILITLILSSLGRPNVATADDQLPEPPTAETFALAHAEGFDLAFYIALSERCEKPHAINGALDGLSETKYDGVMVVGHMLITLPAAREQVSDPANKVYIDAVCEAMKGW